jgi:lysophospholipase L1-like esterase
MKQEISIIKSLILALCLVLAASGCSGGSTDANVSAITQCTDGIDNDNDGFIDLNDAGCSSAADNNEINDPDPVPTAANAARANSYDDAWESAWVANAKTILSTPVGITKTIGKVLQVGDSMTFSYAYGDWARKKTGATASDLDTINWMHAGVADPTDGWQLSSDGTTAADNANWGSDFVDNIFVDPDLNDAQFAVVMFNVNNITYVEDRIKQFINAGIVPVLSTIPPRTNLDYNMDFADPYNAELLALAEKLSLPIIDYSKEILLRRPDGTWGNTLISDDGVHPSGKRNVYTPISDPYADGGDASTHTTGDAALNSGYLLRTWLTVQKMKEIKQKVVD